MHKLVLNSCFFLIACQESKKNLADGPYYRKLCYEICGCHIAKLRKEKKMFLLLWKKLKPQGIKVY